MAFVSARLTRLLSSGAPSWRKKSVRPFERRCRYVIAVEAAREGCYKCQKLHEFPF